MVVEHTYSQPCRLADVIEECAGASRVLFCGSSSGHCAYTLRINAMLAAAGRGAVSSSCGSSNELAFAINFSGYNVSSATFRRKNGKREA